MSIANTCRNNGVPVGSTHSCGPRIPWCVTNLCHGLCYVSIALFRVFNQARGPFIVSDPPLRPEKHSSCGMDHGEAARRSGIRV